jgi:predicted acylesterase/phospholipase RssA
MLRRKGKTALVLAGGGIMGAAYEIGVLTALDQLFAEKFSSNRFDMFVGVSAGSVIAALVANQIPPGRLFQAINRDEKTVFNWRRSDIYRFESSAVLKSIWKVSSNLFRIYRSYRQSHTQMSLQDLIYILQEQFPAGLFSLDPMQNYLCQSFAEEGICDTFSKLKTELYIPAYDLDTGERVIFGKHSHEDVHICQAITASCAIPYFFRPQKIGGRYYIDGNTGRTTHIDIAIEQGATLIVLVNPRVPMNNDPERTCLPSLSYGDCASIANLGISCAWEQAQRIENQEKLVMAMELYKLERPDVDILVLQPGPEESLLFFQSPMSQLARNHIMRYGYHLSLGQLNANFEEFAKAFKRQGIKTSAGNLRDRYPSVS